MPEPDPPEADLDDAIERALGESITRGLARGVRAGDQQKFEALYARLAPALAAWANLRIRVGLRSRLDPEDLMQEVWIRALTAFPNYDPERGPFRPWFFQVAKYVLLDAFRRLRPAPIQPGAPEETGGWRLSRVPDDGTSVSRQVARQDGLRAFLAEVEALEEDDRTLLVHCGLEGMRMADVAAKLGLSPAATEKRWQRLRARLATKRWPEGLLDE